MTDLVTAVEAAETSDPIVLIVEDRATQRMEKARAMVARGCVPIPVEGTDAAARELAASPGIDLVLADIHLVPSEKGDKSGVELARFVKADYPHTPVVGYSAYFAADDLSPEELKLFSYRYGKGQSTVKEIKVSMDRCAELAREARTQRRARAETRLASSSKGVSEMALEIVRSASLAEVDEVEQVLHEAGFRLKLVTIPAAGSPEPLIVWVRSHEGCVDVEVYGHSSLYVTGETESEAMEHLIDLIQVYWEELQTMEQELSGPAGKLHDFLADLKLEADGEDG
jgi:CheY-like chemotaxis protein